MTHRTIGIDLAIRGDQVAQVFDDGRPVGRPVRFRPDPGALDAFAAQALEGLAPGTSAMALMEPTGMSWFPVAHRLVDAGIEVIRVKGKHVRALHPEDVLRTIPGIGDHLAPVLIGILHAHERFRSGRHLRGFCGLFPGRSDSGGAERPGQKITQGGNDRIKRALILAADTARRIDPELAEVYWRLMTTREHHHKQARCAVANRLVNRILSVPRSGRPCILRDTDGTAITFAQARGIIAERCTVPEAVRASRRSNRAQETA